MLKELMKKGLPVILAEVRGHAPDVIEYSDKKTGQKVSSPLHRFAVETGDMAHTRQFKVMVWRPSSDFANIKRGDFILFALTKMDTHKGECSCEERDIAQPTPEDMMFLSDEKRPSK